MNARTMAHYASKIWDCVVIGAGPAGAMAARQIAKKKNEVLLIDKAAFPRAKVCGCCINNTAAATLQLAGLGELLEECGAVPLNSLTLFDGNHRTEISLPISLSLSREKFDMALVNAAIDSGAQFLSQSSAKVLSLENLPCIQVRKEGSTYTMKGKIVIVADGLAGNSLDAFPEFKSNVRPYSRFGASVIINQIPDYVEFGKIYMACGADGYVGMVRLEDGRLNVAAALDHKFSKQFSGPGEAASQILQDCGLSVPIEVIKTHWTGTNLLTRVRPVIAGTRLFIAGDSCGYAEPFTGEGMGWALYSGLTVADLAVEGIECWNPSLITKWQRAQKELVKRKSRSQIIGLVLRSGLFRKLLINFCAVLPAVPNYLAAMISTGDIEHRRRIFDRG